MKKHVKSAAIQKIVKSRNINKQGINFKPNKFVMNLFKSRKKKSDWKAHWNLNI